MSHTVGMYAVSEKTLCIDSYRSWKVTLIQNNIKYVNLFIYTITCSVSLKACEDGIFNYGQIYTIRNYN